MAEWTNQVTPTPISFSTIKSTTVGSYTLYWTEVSDYLGNRFWLANGMGSSNIIELEHTAASRFFTEVNTAKGGGFSYNSYDAVYGNWSSTRFYWTGSTWSTRSSSQQTLLGVRVTPT